MNVHALLLGEVSVVRAVNEAPAVITSRSKDVGDVVDDLLVADAPRPVGPAEGELVVARLDGLDGALGAERAGRPAALRPPAPGDVEGNELGVDSGFVAVDGDEVVVGGVVAPAQGRVRCHGRCHGRRDLCSPGEGSQRLRPVRAAVLDLDYGVGLVELGQRLPVAPVRGAGVPGDDFRDLVLSAHGVLQFSLWCLSVRQNAGRLLAPGAARKQAHHAARICTYEKYIFSGRSATVKVAIMRVPGAAGPGDGAGGGNHAG